MALTMCVCSGRFRLKGLQAICQAVSHFLHTLPLVSNPMPLTARARRRGTAMTEGRPFLELSITHWCPQSESRLLK